MRGFDGKMREGARERTEIDSGDCGICYAVRGAAQNMDLKASGMRCGVAVKGKGWGMIASSHARAAAVGRLGLSVERACRALRRERLQHLLLLLAAAAAAYSETRMMMTDGGGGEGAERLLACKRKGVHNL